MSCQNCSSLPEILTLLQELKSKLGVVETKCIRIEKEILGISDEAAADPTSLMENITLKQIVERTAYDLDSLRKRIDEAEDSRRVAVQSTEQSSIDELGDESMDDFTAERIICDTMDAEKHYLRLAYSFMVTDRALVKGKSFRGRTAAEVARSLATHDRPSTLALVINNHLDETVTIVNTWEDDESQSRAEQLPAEIPSGHQEVLKFSSPGHIAAMIDLAIGASPMRIVLKYQKYGGNQADVMAFITTHANFELSDDLFGWAVPEQVSEHSTTIAYDPTWEGAKVFAKLGDILIGSAADVGVHSVATLDIGSIQGLEGRCSLRPCAVIPVRLEDNLKPGLRQSGKAASVLTSIRQSHACVIQFVNGLPVDMSMPLCQMFHSKLGKSIPLELKSQTSGCAVAHHEREFDGIISYRLGFTDLHLALGFRLSDDEENEVSIGFIPVQALKNSFSLHYFLFDDHPYLTEPSLARGKASQGPLRIIQRNIMAEATITNSKKAVVEVLICTF